MGTPREVARLVDLVAPSSGTKAAGRFRRPISCHGPEGSDVSYGVCGVDLARVTRYIATVFLLALLFGVRAPLASAGTADELTTLPTLDALNRSESPLSNGGKWSALSWASGTAAGADTTSGWGPVDAFSTVNGAFWNPSTFSDKTGSAAAVTMQVSPGLAERYVALWLDMASPGSAKSGYQLRWTYVSSNTYSVTLSKWSSGTQTVLASNASVSIPIGTTMAISDNGGTVGAWQGSGGALSSLLSASDAAYASGYAGIEGSGNYSRLTNFKAGPLLGAAITGTAVLDNLERAEVPLATGNWSKSSWASEIGGAWMGLYRGYGSEGGLAGAWWNPSSFSDAQGGDLVAGTVGTGAPKAGEYLGLWLNMPSPGSARSGYEARFTGVNGLASNYKVELSKWVSGTRTVLVSKEGFSLAVGTTMSLTDAGGTVALWTGTSSMLPLLTASDATYASGYAGLEVNGIAGTIYNFKAGAITADLPTAMTEAAISISETGATLNGQVNPRGYATTYQFEYGTTTSYGTKVPATAESVGSGTSNVAVSKAISGLKGGTTYHYRVSAANAYGTTGGLDKTFTTLKPPTVITEAAGGVKEHEATLKASVNPNGSATTYQFEYGATSSYGTKVPLSPESVGSGTTAVVVSKAISGLEEGATYHYRVVASNVAGIASGADKTLKTTHPPQTTITSPAPTYTSHEEQPIKFESSQAGSTFKCGFDEGSTPTKSCNSPFVLPEHLDPGPELVGPDWHSVVIAAVNSEGQVDQTPARWFFNTNGYLSAVSTDKLTSPDEGAKSGSYLTLASEWEIPLQGESVSSVAYELKAPSWGTFKPIPSQYLWNAEGGHPGWALEVKGNKSPPLFFNIKAFAKAEGWAPVVDGLQLRAVFNGGYLVAGASQPASVTYSRFAGGSGDDIEQVGPASVDLVTGAYTITRTDVSIPVPGTGANLEFTRTYNSAYGANEKTNSKTLGQMWQPSAPVEAEYEEEAWQKVLVRHEDKVPPVFEKECWNEEGETIACGAGCPPEFCEEWEAQAEIPEQNWVEVLGNEGAAIPFERIGSAPYTYVPPEEAKEFALSQLGSSFILADSNGTKTEFTQNEEAPTEYAPSKVSYAGTKNQARLTYGISEKKKRLLSAIGPAPAGVECNPLEKESNYAPKTKGCRSIYFTYVNFTIEGAPSEQRLDRITYYDSSGSGTGQVVARYGYFSASGNLSEEWDPRVTPEVLKERYAYESTKDARLTRLTPAGQEPWQLAYYPAGSGGPYEAKLKSVSRASLLASPSTATTTIAYDVPISGEGTPYDLGISAVSKWGQSDYPVDATAVFPPTEVPGEKPSDYDQAAVHYLDPGGHEVNTAQPSPPGIEGDSITTTETDMQGNVVRELSPQNRLRALESPNPVERSQELDTHSEYSADGTEVLQSWGPLHQVQREAGGIFQARRHTTIKYDEGAPALKEGETAPRLPTTETVAANVAGRSDLDPRVSKTGYNWELRKPTEQITDPSGLNVISKTVYNSAGQVIEERQPSDTEGKKAGTTKTVYWTAAANPDESKCGFKPAWAGLPCLAKPVAEPSPAESNPKLPGTRFIKYSTLDQLEESYEEINLGGLPRTTTVTYDAAGRPLTSRQKGIGTEVLAIRTTYNESNGLPESQYFVCEAKCEGFDTQEVKTTYDKLARPIEYLDADGNKSGVAYDVMGRPVIVSDGKGAQQFTYDEDSGLATEMTDSAAGSFKATYNADGQMIEQLLPNGLAQKLTYDPEGTAVSLQYVKESFCSSACTWLSFNREDSIQGQVLNEKSNLGTDSYSYDKAGRLTQARETPTGEGCTTRSYGFDNDSNRTSKSTYGPGIGGACSFESEVAKQTYAYDSADRLIGDGVEYDDLGRTTTLPAKYAGPAESWRIGGKTLAERKLSSASFSSSGNLILNLSSWSLKLECQMYSNGKLSGAEGIEESFELNGCGLYAIEGGKKGKQLSCGTVKAYMPTYTGTASGMYIYMDPGEKCLSGSGMTMPMSSFHHEFPNEEGQKLAVKSTGKAKFGTNPVEVSASSTWQLITGEKLGFSASGPIANEGELTTAYYVNDRTRSQTQGGITNTYSLDASLRQRERITSGGSEAGTQIYHYAGSSDSPAWVDEGGSKWSRSIAALGGSLGAIQTSSGEVTLQLADLHGDVVATAAIHPEATKLLDTQRFDEFGDPLQSSPLSGGDAEFGWLGSKNRRTQLPSGVIQMGVRSYVPAVGRFLSPDPVRGGSDNTYDYANADPLNQFDLTGTIALGQCRFHVDHPHPSTHRQRKSINVVLHGACIGSHPGVATAKVRMSIYNGHNELVARGHWRTVKVPIDLGPVFPKSGTVGFGAGAPKCVPGNYRGVAEIVLYPPPPYNPKPKEGASVGQIGHISSC